MKQKLVAYWNSLPSWAKVALKAAAVAFIGGASTIAHHAYIADKGCITEHCIAEYIAAGVHGGLLAAGAYLLKSPLGQKLENTMKTLTLAFLCLAVSLASFAQTAPTASSGAFPTTSITLNLNPVTLPGLKQTVAGAETDVMLAPSNSFALGETSLVSSSMVFAGGRGNYIIKPVSTWIQNHSPNLNGYQFQFGLTGSVGVVKPVGNVGTPHWGERFGVFVNYAVNGNWGTGVDVEWGNFPGVQHNTWTLAFGPNFHF